MKKFMIVGAVVLVAVVALGIAGFAYAQSQTPTTPQPGTGAYGAGMMGGRGMMGRYAQGGQQAPYGQGMMGGMRGQYAGTGEGPLHEYMVAGFAEAFDLTVEQIEARLDAGDTIWTIAQEQGLTQEQFATLMTQVRTDALNQAVADGVITQAQADLMLQHFAQMQANGFGPGNCMGGGAGRMFRNQVPAQP